MTYTLSEQEYQALKYSGKEQFEKQKRDAVLKFTNTIRDACIKARPINPLSVEPVIEVSAVQKAINEFNME